MKIYFLKINRSIVMKKKELHLINISHKGEKNGSDLY
ncbi:hypothetical protein LCGC14_1580890 [marine sediment metagenome]|uniref:Uncharacterized protein n=1 Tax=marine sediment metagenome TaxID=412755 RepID=A0A0F9LH32_9ZZZZ